MKNIQKVFLLGVMITMSLQAGQQASLSLKPNQVQQQENKTALNMIQAMQECINLNQKVQHQVNQSLNAAQIQDQRTLWEQAVQFVTDLRKESDTPNASNQVNFDINNKLMMQINQHKNLFSRLLDEYISHFGQVHEKQGTFFGSNGYYLSSKDDKNLSITPNEYTSLVQTLESAAKQANWKQTIELRLLVLQDDIDTVSRTLTLNDITTAIKQVPLPIGYFTIAAGLGTAAALGAGAYYAYNNYSQGLDALEDKVDNISNALETPNEKNSTWWSKLKDNAEVNAQNADLATYAAAGADSELTSEDLQNSETPEELTQVVQDYVIPAANVASIAIPAAQVIKAGAAVVASATMGAERGIVAFGATKPVIPTFPASTVKPAVIKPVAPTPVSTIGQQYEHLPAGYVKPPMAPTKASPKISPNWETYFGR